MDRNLLQHLPIVEAVARFSSFSKAASNLNISPSTVSHAVRMVEDYVGVPVFSRTTRDVHLTEAGTSLLRVLTPNLRELDDVVEQVRATHGVISGTLRINTPRSAIPMAITPILKLLDGRHPALTVEITSDEAFSDIVSDGFDAGVRLGSAIAQDMIAVRLTPPFDMIVVASPAYIEKNGCPLALQELQHHNCIGYRRLSSGGIYDWELSDNGEDVAISVPGTLRVTDALFARELALESLGISYLFEPLVTEGLLAGRLKQLLPDIVAKESGFFLYFPESMKRAPKLRAFIDVARSLHGEL